MKVFGAFISLVGVMLLGSVTFAATCPESVPAPQYQVGDRFVWEYTNSGEKVWEVTGINGGLTEIKWSDPDARLARDNAGTYFLDRDWVITKGLDKQGNVVMSPKPSYLTNAFTLVGKKLLDFPLHLGKAWDVSFMGIYSYSAIKPFYLSVKVVGCEEVATRAGTFQAVKIAGTLTDGANTGWRPMYLWYSPAAKNIIQYRTGQCVPMDWCSARAQQEFDLIKLELK